LVEQFGNQVVDDPGKLGPVGGQRSGDWAQHKGHSAVSVPKTG